MKLKLVKLFLRIALSIGFLSAVADRFGLWPQKVSVWGNWIEFVQYTQVLNPWFPMSVLNILAIVATAAELILAICLLIGYKTKLSAILSGYLLLLFGLAMAFTIGIKSTFDYSVFSASAAAFALSTFKGRFLEVKS